MASDLHWPGPDGSYPNYPRDKDGYPIKRGGVQRHRTADGRVITIDTTPHTPDGTPIHDVAPRLVRPTPTGGVTRAQWLTSGARVEDIYTSTPEGNPVRIARNIDTGQQVEW
jgi:hypothetical protein